MLMLMYNRWLCCKIALFCVHAFVKWQDKWRILYLFECSIDHSSLLPNTREISVIRIGQILRLLRNNELKIRTFKVCNCYKTVLQLRAYGNKVFEYLS